MSDLDPSAADAARHDRPGDEPPRAAAAGHLVGRVEASSLHTERSGGSSGETSLTFRLSGPRGGGARDVRLSGYTISGRVSDGDWVEVGERERSGPLEVLALLNLTTGTEVRVLGRPAFAAAPLVRNLLVVLVVLVLLIVVRVVLGLLGVVDHGWPFGAGGLTGGGSDGRLDPGTT